MNEVIDETIVRRSLCVQDDLVRYRVGDPGGLHGCFLERGQLHSLRYGSDLLINLVQGCPLSGSLQRLYVELGEGEERRVVPLIAPESAARFHVSVAQAVWCLREGAMEFRAALSFTETSWSITVSLDSTGDPSLKWRAFWGMDVGLSTPGAARNNEAYVSQYLDHRVLEHPDLGSVVATRQNLAVHGAHPFLLQGCVEGCVEVATDARDVFGGPVEREKAMPPFLREPGGRLPGLRQGESSYVGLRSRWLDLAPGAAGRCRFFGIYSPDHPEASSQKDMEALSLPEDRTGKLELPEAAPENAASFCADPAVWQARDLEEQELRELFPDAWRCEEHSPEGAWYSFYTGEDARHVVSRAKEAAMARPHATILRSGQGDYPSCNQLTTTCFAAGVFNALLSAGHPSFHRLLSFPRESCGLHASTGQRVWMRDGDGSWKLLGVPSAFEMGLMHARWIYQFETTRVEIRVETCVDRSCCEFKIKVEEGGPREFLVSHGLIAGINEYDAPAEIEFHPDAAMIRVRAAEDNLWRQLDPAAVFTLQATEPQQVLEVGGAEILGGQVADAAMVVFRTAAVEQLSLELIAESGLPADDRGANWLENCRKLKFEGPKGSTDNLNSILPWFVHNGMIHFTVPHGVEQYNGGAWGSRDVTQGSVELLLALGSTDSVRKVILETYRHQYEKGAHWPQWFMLEPFGHIQQAESHGDIPLWPLKALCDYLEASSDFAILEEQVAWSREDGQFTDRCSSLAEHVEANIDWMRQHCVPGTALLRYGDGDWNDSLQPAKPELKKRLVSAWTVSLSYQVLRRLEALCLWAGFQLEALEGFADAVSRDFHRFLIIDGTVCGFFLFDPESSETGKPMLHPADEQTGIHYRLLPMTRSMIGGLFSAEEAEHHCRLINEHLLAADGARLMDRPPSYRGGVSAFFQRAESSSCFSREIGIFYTHAHLRYIEAMARLGKADEMLLGFEMANPAGIWKSVPHSLPRQGNSYFSSSDAVVASRHEAEERYADIREGKIAVEGGWRIYSSGPGIFLNLLFTRMVGVRKVYDKLILDPVIPKSLDGLQVEMPWGEGILELHFVVEDGEYAARSISVNGEEIQPEAREENPYRDGGWVLDAARCEGWERPGTTRLDIRL
jgi:cellobiose phosphorylase